MLISSHEFSHIGSFSFDRWTPCGEAEADATSAPVDDLTEGKKYKFRVRAVNKEGQSEPLESQEAVTAKNPYRYIILVLNLQRKDIHL